MKKKIPTITVAISAYNEEKNIINFLKSVLAQKELNFILERILVISDGSTDKTVKFARAFKSKKIKVIDCEKRIGKSSRLNEIYSQVNSDVLVQSDADVVFANPYVIYNIIQPLIIYKNVVMCGGNPTPYPGKTWIEKAVNLTCDAYREFRYSVRKGDNVFSADGRLLAFKNKILKKINIPSDMIANDAYAYYSCISRGCLYKFVPEAVVFFRSPSTIKDQIRQNKRFLAAPIRMSRYFDGNLIRRELNIPKFLKLKIFLKIFINHPFYCSFIYTINKYCYLLAKSEEKSMNAKWEIAKTTKNLSQEVYSKLSVLNA